MLKNDPGPIGFPRGEPYHGLSAELREANDDGGSDLGEQNITTPKYTTHPKEGHLMMKTRIKISKQSIMIIESLSVPSPVWIA